MSTPTNQSVGGILETAKWPIETEQNPTLTVSSTRLSTKHTKSLLCQKIFQKRKGYIIHSADTYGYILTGKEREIPPKSNGSTAATFLRTRPAATMEASEKKLPLYSLPFLVTFLSCLTWHKETQTWILSPLGTPSGRFVLGLRKFHFF